MWHTGCVSIRATPRIAASRAARLATPPTPRRADTARRLLEAAAALICEKGLANTSVNAICRKAGFTRGAFYSSFRDIDDLLVTLVDDRYSELGEIIRQNEAAFENVGSDVEADDIIRAARQIGYALPSSRDFYLLHDELVLCGARNKAIGELMRRYDDELAASLADLIEETLAGSGLRLTVDPLAVADHTLARCSRFYRRILLSHTSDQKEIHHAIDRLAEEAIPFILRAAVERIPAESAED